MSERVGRTLAAMVRCMLADSGLPKFLWRELMFTAAFLVNRAPHSAIDIQSPYKIIHRTEPDLRLLRVIGARAFVHIETYSKKLELKAVEGRLVGYSNNNKIYRVSSHPAHYGETKRHLHRDTIAPIPVTVGRKFAAG